MRTQISFGSMIIGMVMFSPLRADIVTLDLFTLGCPTEFSRDASYWTTNFDLGVTFTAISHVYMDWSGEILAGLAIRDDNPTSVPMDVGVYAALKNASKWRHTDVWGGETTYPAPEPFEQLSEFIYGDMPLSYLFDGKGQIGIQYTELIMLDGGYIEGGSISFDKVTLVVDGVLVPEPATFLLMGAGIIVLKRGVHSTSRLQQSCY